MKKHMKKISVTILAAGFVLANVFTSFAGWEQQADNTWKYKRENGEYLADCWTFIDGNGDTIAEMYHFNADGIMSAGTDVIVDGVFDGTVNENGARLDKDGNVITTVCYDTEASIDFGNTDIAPPGGETEYQKSLLKAILGNE